MMDWGNKFRYDLASDLENVIGKFEVEKDNPGYGLGLHHSYDSFNSLREIKDFKIKNKGSLVQMRFNITEEIPGIDGTRLLDDFNYKMQDLLKSINIEDIEIPLKIFLTRYFALFDKYIVELQAD